MRFREALRLIVRRQRVQFAAQPPTTTDTRNLTADVHRFEQSIAGRAYVIEVAAVAKDRWRATIVRLPGLPTAMMPFYGRTPIEAAERLGAWLTRAHERAAAPSP